MRFFKFVVVVAAFCLLVPASRADVVYTYVGNNFTATNGNFGQPSPFTNSNFVTITLTFSNALSGGMAMGVVAPTSWTMSDGNSSWFGSGPGASFSALLATNALGQITQWSIGVSSGLFQSGFYTIGSSNSEDASHTFFGDGSVTGNPGTWTSEVVATPEPATLLMGGAGAALGFIRKRKFRVLNRRA